MWASACAACRSDTGATKPLLPSRLSDLNRVPSPYHGDALPSELRRQVKLVVASPSNSLCLTILNRIYPQGHCSAISSFHGYHVNLVRSRAVYGYYVCLAVIPPRSSGSRLRSSRHIADAISVKYHRTITEAPGLALDTNEFAPIFHYQVIPSAVPERDEDRLVNLKQPGQDHALGPIAN